MTIQPDEPIITEAYSGIGMDTQETLIASVAGKQVATATRGLLDVWTLRDQRGVTVNIIGGEPATREALINLARGTAKERP